MKIVRGADLKKFTLKKFLLPDMVQRGFQWREGRNEDTLPLDLDKKYSSGLYFTEESYVGECVRYFSDQWTNVLDCWLADVSVDDDEVVVQDGHKDFRAHTVTLSNVTRLRDLPDQQLFRIATLCQMWGDPLKSKDKWSSAVHTFGYPIVFLEEQTQELCELAIEHDSSSVRYVRQQTDKVCWAALRQHWSSIEYIRAPTLDMLHYVLDRSMRMWDVPLTDEQLARIVAGGHGLYAELAEHELENRRRKAAKNDNK